MRDSLKGELGHGGLAVQRDSAGVYRELADDLAARGVIFTDLDGAVREYPDLVREHLMAQTVPTGGKLAALHAAFWSGGAFVYVPRNVEVELPLHSLTWADRPGLAVTPHTLVILEHGSQPGVRGRVRLPGRAATRRWPTAVWSWSLARARGCITSRFRGGGPGTFNLGSQKAALSRDAQLTTLSVVLGSRFTKSWMDSALREPGGCVQMVGMMFGSGDQRFHHHTLQDHLASEHPATCCTRWRFRWARSEYSGLIRVHQDRQKTDAYQANRNLLP